MTAPELSIITPTLNQAKYIEDCLKSVKNQSSVSTEHIVIDGGSDDGTIRILEEYESEYNLRWISEPDEGQSNALNKGIEMAKGEWIGWQNSDDYYLDCAFKQWDQARSAENNADVIYGDVKIVNEDGTEIDQLFMTSPSKFMHKYWSMYMRNQAAFFHSSVFGEVGYFDENLKYAMDADFFLRLLEANVQFVRIPNALGVFRRYDDSKTYGKFSTSQYEEWNRIHEHGLLDEIMPLRVLEGVGQGIKFFKLLIEFRFEAFIYEIEAKL